MGQISIVVPPGLRIHADGKERICLQADSVGSAIRALKQNYGGLAQRICVSDGEIHRFVNLFVNRNNIRELDGLHTPLHAGDELSILVALAGG